MFHLSDGGGADDGGHAAGARAVAGRKPAAYLHDIIGKWQAACPVSVAGAIQTGTTNNYPEATLQLSCPRNPGTGGAETATFRAMQGAETLYLVQYALWRRGPRDIPAQI